MASLAVCKACEKRNKELGRKIKHENGEINFKPNLFIAGVDEIIDMSKAVELSETDKRRHEKEDKILRFINIEN